VFGEMMTASPCPRCGGVGQEIVSPCPRCGGAGRERVSSTLTVAIPAGISDGARLRVTGRGEAGMRGGRAGDLYVSISVTPHDVFRRAGDDLGCEITIPMTVAALGGTVEVPTLDGSEEIDISPGTQSGQIKHLKGHGMPNLNGHGKGELIVLLKVDTPTNLDQEQVDAIQHLAQLRGEKTGDPRSFFDKIKEAFQ
jgi:molecular chaperone DnaJ